MPITFSNQQKKHFEAEGYLIIESFISHKAVDEIRDLVLRNIKPTRSFKEDENEEGKDSSALGSLGLKPKPAV